MPRRRSFRLRFWELAHTIALCPVSLGGILVYLGGNETYATVSVEVPAGEMLHAFGLSLDEFDLFLGGTYGPLATYLGLKYSSRRHGEIWTWQLSR